MRASVSQVRPSASFSATLRVHLDDRPGRVRRGRPRDRRRRRQPRRDRPRPRRGGQEGPRRHGRRGERRPHRADRRRRPARSPGVEVEHVSDRTFLLHLGGKIEMASEVAAEDARRPLDGLHARRRARLHGDRRGLEQGLEPDDQAEHRRRRQRRHRRARARRHRPRGGDAGDGGQGDAVQGVRRRRRLADLPRDDRSRRDRRRGRGDRARASAASTSRTSRRRAASRSRAGCKEQLDIPVFHDDQHGTAIVVLAAFLNALQLVGKRARGRAGRADRRRRRRRRDDRHAARPRRPRRSIGCDRQGAIYLGRDELGPWKAAVRGAHEPATASPARRTRRWPAPTSSSASPGPGAVIARRRRVDGRRRDRVRDGEPDARGAARGDRGPRRRRRDGPLRLPEPDQQRARVPRRSSAARSTSAPRRSTRR